MLFQNMENLSQPGSLKAKVRHHNWLFWVSLVLYVVDIFLPILYLLDTSHGHLVSFKCDVFWPERDGVLYVFNMDGLV